MSFVVWISVAGIHVLAYATRATKLGLADFIPGRSLPGALSRQGLVVGGLLLGLVLAIAMMRGLHT